ncbi:MAG: GNAT family protein [Ilumatobacteraceae bacterium]
MLLRPLSPTDFRAYAEVRSANLEWVLPWEPLRPAGVPDPSSDREAFAARCIARDRDRHSGQSVSLGMFVDGTFIGETNLNNVQRGAMQSCTVGYWVDRRHAGHHYVPEAVVIAFRHAFEDLRLHRVEICIVPRNHRSRRVMEKLGIREEGVAERYVEIAGVWEDHVRYGITVEEWLTRRDDFVAAWL